MKRRILVLLNDYNLPPPGIRPHEFDRDDVLWIGEYDVITNLQALGHEVLPLPVSADLAPIKEAVESFKPHVVFNLLLEFKGETIFDQNVLAYLELLGVPYTGCNHRGYMLARDKVLAKQLFEYHGIKTPKFMLCPQGQTVSLPKELAFPLIVKCVTEDASLGMTQSSLVSTVEKLQERVAHLHADYRCDVIVEEFIEGRELYVGVLGNDKLTVLPTWELLFRKAKEPDKEFYHTYAKWNNAYRKRKGICTQKAKLTDAEAETLAAICKKTYKALNLNGYARFDFRMTTQGDCYVLEVNPNPDISKTEDFAASAKAVRLDYPQLLNRIINLGVNK